MYLMNVPPVAATRTEWRTCGPSRGYSLPLCFNDSDTKLSTRVSPIQDKVQMIIESLRSTQSSLDMGDEIEGNVPSGHQVCKVAVGPYVGPKSKTKGPAENQQADVSSPIKYQSHDSDSDDSVDRGIEEAILEYLKEKDDHKRKAEPSSDFLQSSKIPRKNPPIPEFSKQHSDSNKVLTASNQFPKSVKVETPTAPANISTKKHIKNKAPFKENPVKRTDANKSTTAKSITLSKEQTKSSSKINSLYHKVKCPVTVKVEEESPDSSSDDGIEEAIQRYQLEKRETQSRREVCKPHSFNEESDSTSDDGIEEAIRCYQLEQLKEKSVLKPFLHRPKSVNKSLHPVGSSSTENVKRQKSRKRKIRTEKEVRSVLPPPPSICIPKNTLADSPKGKGNGPMFSSKVESFREQRTPVTPKVNTTAELMCAEAILDISKAVMPGAFNPNVGLTSCNPAQSSTLPSNCPDDGSDDSSIDSEDGIEQEIRKFLEQKAQMHQQPLSSAAVTTETGSTNELDKVKAKPPITQKKPLRLSLTQKRKLKEEHNISKESMIGDRIEDVAVKSLPEHGRESSPLVFSQRSQTQPLSGLEKTEQSGEKSSSLDSDEDLDTAIKDLLKTKKKMKKKRGFKLKSKKCLKDAGPMPGNILQTKMLKPDPTSKHGGLKKVQKSRDDMRERSKLSKKSILWHKQANLKKENVTHTNEMDKLKGTGGQDTSLLHNTQAVQIKEDSSSVDSDDSIEQEIRKFLAEKAKVSTTAKTKDGDVSRNGNVEACTPLQDKDVKLEIQLAEIPRKCVTPLPGRSMLSSPESKTSQDREPFPTPQISLPNNSSSTPTVSAPPCLSSVPCNSSSLVEPADGAGAARTGKRRSSIGSSDVQDVTSDMVRVRPLMSPSIAQSRSDSVKWRQSLGLPTTEARSVCLSRTPFHIASSKTSETASVTPPYHRGGINPKPQTPVTASSSARSSKTIAPSPCSAETSVNIMSHSPFSSLLSAARQHPGMSFSQGLAPGGHRAQYPMAGQAESMVHMSKDQSVFIELESNRTNHVKVRSREMSEGKERRDLQSEKKRGGESMNTEDKVQLGRAEEDFIDVADCESDKRRNPEKKQGFSTLSLSSAIDPGITISPCIALTTEERSRKFSRRYKTAGCNKEIASLTALVQNSTVENVKRKLQFAPVLRRNEAARQPAQQNRIKL